MQRNVLKIHPSLRDGETTRKRNPALKRRAKVTLPLRGGQAARGGSGFLGILRGGVCWIITGLLLTCSGVGFSKQNSSADLLITNANVITLNPKQPAAQAVAVKDGRITWVGDTAEAARLFADARQNIDAGGATVMPGIIDSHTHLLTLGETFLKVNLKDVHSEKEVVARIRQLLTSFGHGEWILGWGWDEGRWAGNYPTHHGLTEATPDNPVFLAGLHGFAGWANKRALDIAGITRETKDPENGKIVRDKSGEPTGLLMNRAQDLLTMHIPPLDLIKVKKAIQLAAEECVRFGLTSVHEARVTPAMVDAFRELIKEGKLPVRVYVMLDGADKALVNAWLAKGPEIDNTDNRFSVRCIKLFADGALGSRGAALLEPYGDQPATRGHMTLSEEQVYDLTLTALKKGFQVATHAVGDAANRSVLNAYERAMKAAPGARDPRLRIEHAQVLGLEDIPRFSRLGVIPSMQPTHATSDMVWAEKRLGPRRIKGAYAWRSIIKTGARVPISSDFPGETLNPFYGIYAAITRQDPSGKPSRGWYPEQRMTVEEALKGYTVEAAYAEFAENLKGSIEPGKLADLIVISNDITRLKPKEVLTIRVLKTIVGGRVVYDRNKA